MPLRRGLSAISHAGGCCKSDLTWPYRSRRTCTGKIRAGRRRDSLVRWGLKWCLSHVAKHAVVQRRLTNLLAAAAGRQEEVNLESVGASDEMWAGAGEVAQDHSDHSSHAAP